MKTTTMRKVAAKLAACVTATVLLATFVTRVSQAQTPLQQLTFSPSDAEILNPERGFYRYTNLVDPWNYSNYRSLGQTLVYGRVDARDFRDQPLSESFLSQIQAGFDAAREHGLKVKFRLSYNDGFDEDAPKDIVLQHIQQLSPLWHGNKDVLFNLDAGFIGAWGEWHASTNGLDTTQNRSDILQAILDASPVDRTVGLRYPQDKREIFSGSRFSDDVVINAENAFDGSDLSRVGHLNDCFLSSETDVGTYNSNIGSWPLSREFEYIGGESLYTIHGGETCAVHARNESSAAIAEMELLHTDYMNLDYHPEVITRWKNEGGFDEIQRRLGYRFQLSSATTSTAVRPRGVLPLEFTIDNVGFGELFNPRDVEVTLTNNDTGETVFTALSVDPRFWSGGQTQTVVTELAIPQDIDEGTYTLGLRMPDKDARLHDDARYSIQFANENIWDANTGVNRLSDTLVISNSVAGRLYVESTKFQEVPGNLTLLGDFNNDGLLDHTDINSLSAAFGNVPASQFDLNNDQQVDIDDHQWWVEQVRQTYLGDANLDGEFNSGDLVAVFQTGLFETGERAGWQTGDWNNDGLFDTGDFVAAFQDGGFEQGPRTLTVVPEPAGAIVFLLSFICFVMKRRFTVVECQ